MRIAMISEHASPLAAWGGEDTGGQNTHVAELSATLTRLGHDVRVYTRRDSPEPPELVHTPEGVAVVHVPAGPTEPIGKDSLLPYMKAFGRWLTGHWTAGGWAPDVMHAHFWMSGAAAVAARRHTGVPVVQTFHALGTVKRRHQGAADTSPPQRIGYERALGLGVDRVVAQCHDEVGELVRMGVPRPRISLVPSGVDSERFSPDGPAAPRDASRARVLTAGRFVPRKGYDDVVRAMGHVPGAECVVVGGPPAGQLDRDPLARQLREVARSSRVGDRLRLTGGVPPSEMPRWYRSADVVALAPWYEPFGLVTLEAMACGVPVVANAVGGLTDTVVAGYTGDLVAPRDPRALGVALRRLLADPSRRFGYGTAALERARRCYSWRRSAEQLSTLYAELSAGSGAGRPVQPVAGMVS